MREIFEKLIDLDQIGKYKKEKLHFMLGDAAISKETAVLRVPVTLNFIIPYEEHLKIKAVIKNKLPILSDVKIEYHYQNEIGRAYV